MATGTNTFLGKAVPLNGESNIIAETAANDIFTITGAASHTGDFLVCETSAGSEVFVVDVSGNVTAAGTLAASGSVSLSSPIAKMVLGTVALASLASNASATVALTGITTAHVVTIFGRGDTTAPLPMVWASDTNKLGYGAPSVACAATTVNYWMFTTA